MAGSRFTFEKTDEGMRVLTYEGDGRIVTVPGEADGRPVTELAAGLFRFCPHIETIVLPASLRFIGNNALDTCTSRLLPSALKHMEIPAENRYFREQDQTIYYFPGGDAGPLPFASRQPAVLLRYYGHDSIFRIPDGVSGVAVMAFKDAELRQLAISPGVRFFGDKALRNCENIERIDIERDGTSIYIPALKYRKEEIYESLYDHIFDYEAYDRLFETYPYVEYRMKMAFCRLDAPVGLTEGMRRMYRVYVLDNLPEILRLIVGKDDVESLRELIKHGFFTEENILGSIEIMSEGDPMMLELLLRHKMDRFREIREDMEL